MITTAKPPWIAISKHLLDYSALKISMLACHPTKTTLRTQQLSLSQSTSTCQASVAQPQRNGRDLKDTFMYIYICEHLRANELRKSLGLL
jgi:hypothetical protein